MNKDKLENFIVNHIDEFNDKEPPIEIWDKLVDIQETKSKKIHWKNVLWKAAVVALIFASSYLVHDIISGQREQYSGINEKNIPILAEANAFYSFKINQIHQEIQSIANDEYKINQEIQIEFKELDSIYAELKKDLKDNAANEEILEAMIQNYRIKVSILEDILGQLKRMNNDGEAIRNENKSYEI